MTDDFRAQGACRGSDVDFFPDPGDHRTRNEAKAICDRCPVFVACQTWALRHEAFGIWGGMSEAERKAVRKAEGIVFVKLTAELEVSEAQCGTMRGWRRHHKEGTPTCEGCRRARLEHDTQTGSTGRRARYKALRRDGRAATAASPISAA